jgi:predicted phage terminase large subunit-like protein
MPTIKPQPGPQENFLATSADIAFYGGAAGGGKSYALLMEPLRHIMTVPGFGAVIFRRESPQITNEGGLWDTAETMYRPLAAQPRQAPVLDWRFQPFGNTVKFSHMQHEGDRFNWQGAQIPLICFDELTHFTRDQFFYMLSRNRTACGVRPYIRATYNPVPPDDETGGWIHEFVGWYLDANGEYPDPAKAGLIRWFVNVNDTLHWFNSRAAAVTAYPDIPPKSFTYIPASVTDNKILLAADPDYLANLYGLGNVDQERLLRANHKIKEAAGSVYNRAWFEIVDALPDGPRRDVRFWDLAATERKAKQGAATAGVRMTRIGNLFFVVDCIEETFNPANTDTLIKNTASQDGRAVAVRWEEEGGSAGKRDAVHIATLLIGYDAMGLRPLGDKLTRGRPLAAQAYAGNVKLLRGRWNEAWLNHMHAIPDGSRWDIHDATTGAFNELAAEVEVVIESNPFYN